MGKKAKGLSTWFRRKSREEMLLEDGLYHHWWNRHEDALHCLHAVVRKVERDHNGQGQPVESKEGEGRHVLTTIPSKQESEEAAYERYVNNQFG